MVVEVVLAGDLCSAEGEDPAQGVTYGCPAGTAEVDRPCRVGGDELEVDSLPGVHPVTAVRRGGGHDLRCDGALRAGIDAYVQESRTGDLHRRDPVHLAESVGQERGEVAWRHPRLLGQLERDVRGVVAMLSDLRSLDDDLSRYSVGQGHRAVSSQTRQDGDYRGRELF